MSIPISNSTLDESMGCRFRSTIWGHSNLIVYELILRGDWLIPGTVNASDTWNTLAPSTDSMVILRILELSKMTVWNEPNWTFLLISLRQSRCARLDLIKVTSLAGSRTPNVMIVSFALRTTVGAMTRSTGFNISLGACTNNIWTVSLPFGCVLLGNTRSDPWMRVWSLPGQILHAMYCFCVSARPSVVSGAEAFEAVIMFSAKGSSLERQHFSEYYACFLSMAGVFAAIRTRWPFVSCSVGSLGCSFDRGVQNCGRKGYCRARGLVLLGRYEIVDFSAPKFLCSYNGIDPNSQNQLKKRLLG